jgi:hypothetical protein
MCRKFCAPLDTGGLALAGRPVARRNHRFVNWHTYDCTNRENRRIGQRTESQIHRFTYVEGAFRSRNAPFALSRSNRKWLRIWTYPSRREIAPTRMPPADALCVLTAPPPLRQGRAPVVAWPLRHSGIPEIKRLAGRSFGWCPGTKRGCVRGLLCGHCLPAPRLNLSNYPPSEVRAKCPVMTRECSVGGSVIMFCSTHGPQPQLLARQRPVYISASFRHNSLTPARGHGARAGGVFRI